MNKKRTIRAIELFAGVGGFRIGLEKAKSDGSKLEVIWSNQWEPATKKQHASDTYIERFGAAGHSNEDIASVKTRNIPDHDLLVGGFPCQDYSVARVLSHASGLAGKKGVLWWQIHRILEEKGTKRPDYIMLENVDRLLKSPSSRRGRDFAVMLASLADLGYAVEWRVVNAADYGMPQRRRRTFILGYRKGSNIYNILTSNGGPKNWVAKDGLIASVFPVNITGKENSFKLEGNLNDVTDNFNSTNPSESPFLNAGVMVNRNVFTYGTKAAYEGKSITLGDVLIENERDVPEEFFIKDKDLGKWKYLKGGKHEKRSGKDGFTYSYNEGPIAFPDPTNKPSRTIITGEGGPTPSRFKHVIRTKSGKYRRLMPLELERLCMFPDNHTIGQPATKRAFFMGNALVVGVIERLGQGLLKMDAKKLIKKKKISKEFLMIPQLSTLSALKSGVRS